MIRLIFAVAVISVSLMTGSLFVSDNFIGNAGDLHLHYYPLKHYITTRIISGELPLWNPYIFCGTPCLANPQGGVFYPGSLIFYIFSNNIPFAFKLWTALHLIFMLFWFYVLIKRFFSPLDDISSFGAAIVIAFSSFVLYMIPAGHIVRLAGYSWFPLCGFLFLGLMDDGLCIFKSGDTTSGYFRRNIFLLLVCSLAFSCGFLSGHPQGVFTVGIFAFAVAVVSLFKHRIKTSDKIRLVSSAVGLWLLLVVLFSFAQYLPSVEFSHLAENISWRPLAKSYSLKIPDFLSLIYPSRWGLPIPDRNNLKVALSVFFEKKNLFIGYCALVLVGFGILAAIRRRDLSGIVNNENKNFIYGDVLFGALLVVGILLSLGFTLPVYGFFYDNFPFLLGYFRTPSRFYFLTVVASGYFAARGINWISFYVTNKNYKVLIGVVIVLVIFAELFIWNKKFIYTMPLDYSTRPEVKISVGERIFTSDKIPANISMMNRIPNVNGYDALILRDYFRTFYSFYEPAVYRPSTFLAPSDDKDILVKDFPGWGLRYFVTASDEQYGEKTYNHRSVRGGIAVYEKKFWTSSLFIPPMVENLTHKGFVSFFPTEVNPVTEAVYIRGVNNGQGYYNGLNLDIKGYSSVMCGEKITIYADVFSPGTFVMGEVFYPGWRVWLDGREIQMERASRIFRSLTIDKTGRAKIHITFMPFSVVMGVAVSVFISVFFIIMIAREAITKSV